VSADKGVVLGLAGTLENEAIRPHVAGPLILRGEAPVISKSPQTTPGVDEDLLAPP
jgi:hypothetical protein